MTDARSDTVALTGQGPLSGVVRVPGDKSISHRVVMISALAEGRSTITGLSDGDDVHRTLVAIESLGAGVRVSDGTVTVDGGRSRLHPPESSIDLGNSGTGMRLLLGILSGLPFTTILIGDDSLSRRPMDRVAVPLRSMGATITGDEDRCLPPLTVTGGALRGIAYTPPMASAQVKSAVLLAGLDADGETEIYEPVPTRAHTEELLALMGANIQVTVNGTGRSIKVRRSRLRPKELHVPGDPSQAAFWLVAAAITSASSVTVADVHLGPERIGFVSVLQRMGADLDVVPGSDGMGSLTSRSAHLRGTDVDADEIPSLDEIPILAVAAAAATGTTRFRRVGELRVKESDRLAATVSLVTVLGATAWAEDDDLIVEGGFVRPMASDFHAGGDHRMAMAAAIGASAAAPGGAALTIGGWSSVLTSYPTFLADLQHLVAS